VLIVDAYNVLHTAGVLPTHLAGLDLAGLLDLISASRYRQQPVLLVCDGRRPSHAPATGPQSAYPHARVLFAGLEAEADELIEQALRDTPRSARVTVVSTDHRLRKAAGRAHARVLRSEVFLHHLAIDHQAGHRVPGHQRPRFATDVPLDRVTLGRWLLELNADDQRLLQDAQAAADAQLAGLRHALPAPHAPADAPKPRQKSPRRFSPHPPPADAQKAAHDAAPGGDNRPATDDLWNMAKWLQRTDIPIEKDPPEPARPSRRAGKRRGRT
jgi:hypothetical protein